MGLSMETLHGFRRKEGLRVLGLCPLVISNRIELIYWAFSFLLTCSIADATLGLFTIIGNWQCASSLSLD